MERFFSLPTLFLNTHLLCFSWNLKEGDHKVEDEPDVDHLDVGSFWKVFWDRDEHCRQNLWEITVTQDAKMLKSLFKNKLFDLKQKTNSVDHTSITVRLTETMASKKKGLK